jgi:hypothetical protein
VHKSALIELFIEFHRVTADVFSVMRKYLLTDYYQRLFTTKFFPLAKVQRRVSACSYFPCVRQTRIAALGETTSVSMT